MRKILIGTLMAMGIGFIGIAGAPAAPINGAALATASEDLSMIEQARGGFRGGGGARRGGGVARGGHVAARGGGVAVRRGGVAVRGGRVAVRGGGVRVRGGRIRRGGVWVYTGGCTYDLYVQGLCY
jgi:hypothetical protein